MIDELSEKGRSVGSKETTFVVLLVIGLSMVYAIVRYNVVRHIPLAHLPLYISNKAFAMSATILIGLSFLLGPLARFWPDRFVKHLYLRKHLGVSGFKVAAIHALISLAILNPAYYPKLFQPNGQMNLVGESIMLMGILAFLIYTAIAVTSLPPIERHMHPDQWKFIQRLGYLAYVLVLGHVAILGFPGWFKPESWQFGLASISLISSLFIVLVLLMRIIVMIFPKKETQ